MSNSGRGRRSPGYWIGAWFPVLAGIGVIVLESTPWFGSDHTSGPLRRVFEIVFGAVSDARWAFIHHYIRKTGHFLGYGLIGLVWLRAWRMSLPRAGFLVNALLALASAGLLATWDEWHQSLVPNRSSSAYDVLLDCCGAAALLLLVYGFLRLFRPERLARGA
jgi:VanZ family protein